MKHLNIRDVCNGIQRRQETRQDVFAKVLEKCYLKIERVAAADRLFVFYEVPMFVVGCPLFRIEDCIMYMKGHLEKNGFLFKYYFPNIVYVSWNKEEIKEHKLTSDLNRTKELDRLIMGSPVGGGGANPVVASSDGAGNHNTINSGGENKMLEYTGIVGGGRGRGAAGGRVVGTTMASRGRKNKIVLNLM